MQMIPLYTRKVKPKKTGVYLQNDIVLLDGQIEGDIKLTEMCSYYFWQRRCMC